MRTILCAAVWLAVAAPAYAQCNEILISFTDWTFEPIDSTTNRMTANFQSNAEKTITMIDASAGYRDELGGKIGTFALPRDVSLKPGETLSVSGLWGPFTFERLLRLGKSDVTTFVCTRAVAYEDGTIERFQK